MAAAMNESRALLVEIAKNLRDVHRNLVDIVRGDYEREIGSEIDAGHLLQLLTKDPHFSWLQELSAFMVTIDELLDESTLSDIDAQAIVEQTRALISPAGNPGSEFSRRYVALLQHHPALTMAHAKLRQTLLQA